MCLDFDSPFVQALSNYMNKLAGAIFQPVYFIRIFFDIAHSKNRVRKNWIVDMIALVVETL